jgi:histidine triad (HIT) family protein
VSRDRAAAACTFCGIVAGATEAHVVVADAHTIAFLDRRPLFLGHTLLVPRRHVTTLPELAAGEVGPFFALAQRLDRAVESATGADGSMVLINNVVSQSVPHLHLHVIPRRRRDGLRFWLGPRTAYAGETAAADMAERIRAAYLHGRPAH